MSAVDIKFYEKKKSQMLYVAISLFILVAAITGALYYYSYTLSSTIQDNDLTLQQIEKSISDIEQDNQVEIYSIYAQNKALFSNLAEWSKIPSMVNHLKRVFAIQWVNYKWFSYSNGTVQTALSLETSDAWYAYEKVTKFLSNYRANQEALFTVDQISNFSGYDRINFTADFTLKNK